MTENNRYVKPLLGYRRLLALMVSSFLILSACQADVNQTATPTESSATDSDKSDKSATGSDKSTTPTEAPTDEATSKILSSEADCPKGQIETQAPEEVSAEWPARPALEGDASDPEPIESTGSNKLDLITTDDPTTFKCLVYLGQGEEEILRTDKQGYELVADAHLFRAEFSDGTTVAMRVHSEVGDANAAAAEVNRYTKALGQLPHVLRADVCRFAVRNGDETATASFGEGMSVQTENMDVRIGDNRMEETLFHEAVHTSLDYIHSYQRSQDWLDAQEADGKWLTFYGRENPDSEDLAETALYTWALINHPDRIPEDEAAEWQKRVPNRISYLEELFKNAPTSLDASAQNTCNQ